MDKINKRRVFIVLLFLAIIGYMLSSKKKKEASQKEVPAKIDEKKQLNSSENKLHYNFK
ncbi:MAG: hypothetical protein AB8B65_19625 [Kordia sp.]|uniref:hypothetical protein n=1 Tax=Kordia sp. TaxID=1965332 RepID=UPI00385A2532